MILLRFWRFCRGLGQSVVRTYRAPTRQFFYFDKAFHSLKHVRLLERIDSLMYEGTLYKDAATTTVAKIQFEGKALIVKRYNTHRFLSGLKQLFKVSKAYNSWFYAHWMMENNILTPKPLAVIEQKLGWLRQRSYYIYQALELSLLMDVFTQEDIDSPKAQNFQERVVDIFKALRKASVHHGDLSIDNFLVNQNEIYLIDLDHMSIDLSRVGAKLMLKRDKKSFLANFRHHPQLHERFKALLSFV